MTTKMGFKNELLCDFEDRGLIDSIASDDIFKLDEVLKNPCVVYCGFDCTADSLHIGSLLPLTVLKKFKDAGHIIIPVIGIATTKIGDPSGRDTARPMLSNDEIEQNAVGINKSISNVLGDVECMRNDEFFEELNVIDFMRVVGQHIPVNKMMRLASVNSRLEKEEGMSFLEFSYSLFQARDFEQIINKFPDHHVIQIGGSDQWGNITMGLELARKTWKRKKPMKVPFGITTPLLVDSNGKKMGKTADGAVWLNEDRLSDFDFWQFWRNIPDGDLARFLRFFSDMLSVELINVLEDKWFDNIDVVNEHKKTFASEVTEIVRGEEAAEKAEAMAQDMFVDKTDKDLPEHIIDKLSINIPLVTFLREEEFLKSANEAKRLIQQGGIRVNGVKIDDEDIVVQEEWGNFKLSIGKKKHFRIVFS